MRVLASRNVAAQVQVLLSVMCTVLAVRAMIPAQPNKRSRSVFGEAEKLAPPGRMAGDLG